jgi:hypothetical protein
MKFKYLEVSIAKSGEDNNNNNNNNRHISTSDFQCVVIKNTKG